MTAQAVIRRLDKLFRLGFDTTAVSTANLVTRGKKKKSHGWGNEWARIRRREKGSRTQKKNEWMQRFVATVLPWRLRREEVAGKGKKRGGKEGHESSTHRARKKWGGIWGGKLPDGSNIRGKEGG